jgi:hypothetical protein
MRSAALLALFIATAAHAQPSSPNPISALEEQRYCGAPKRDARGEIIRRADVRNAFRRAHPCPVTGLASGACPGWSIDHVIPLACGGCDAVSNLQWLPNALKTAAITRQGSVRAQDLLRADAARAAVTALVTYPHPR